MSALIKWIFLGGHDGSELSKKRGEQRAFPFDVVYDEMLGNGKLVGYAAGADGDLTIEYIEEGNKMQRQRTAGNIYVLAQREERTMRAAGSFAAFFGATKPPEKKKAPGTKTPGAKTPANTPAVTPVRGATPTMNGGVTAPAAVTTPAAQHLLLGADYDDSEEEAVDEASASKKVTVT